MDVKKEWPELLLLAHTAKLEELLYRVKGALNASSTGDLTEEQFRGEVWTTINEWEQMPVVKK